MRLLIVATLLAGCAGSPARTSTLSPEELYRVDDYTLCKAATPRSMYTPAPKVVVETQRRGLNCAAIYQWVPPEPVVTQTPPPYPMPAPTRQVHCTTIGAVTNCN